MLIVLAVWCLFVGCVGTVLGLVACIMKTKVFWYAVIGGLIGYLLGYQTDKALVNCMILGGGLALLEFVSDLIEDYTIFRIIFWTLGGIVIGAFLSMTIIGGIIGLGIGLWKALS
ncbi:MAG: hypothetical protein IJ660_03260 [Alphaproteobacteria bacterium]|nr:hypothetical protein [Alphaproteobacteria bacterium]